MKKLLVISLIVVAIINFGGSALAFDVFTPGGESYVSQEDITYAETIFDQIKWDVSKAKTEKIITLTLPKVTKNYMWGVQKDNGEYIGIWLHWEGVYSGFGGENVVLNVTNPDGMGIYLSFFNYTNGKGIAQETFIYYPDSGVNYIPPEDRRAASADDNGNVTGYIDVWNNPAESWDAVITFPHKYMMFSDLDSSYWAYKVIYELTAAGYIKGYPDGTFRPNGNITRAEFAAIMSNLLKNKYPAGSKYDTSGMFPDFMAKHWAYEITNQLLGYMSREEATRIFGSKFLPDKKITREEVVAVIHAVLKNHSDFNNTVPKQVVFKDMTKARFADGIVFGVGQGFIKGYPDGTFKPQGNITRAEIAAILVLVNKAL